MSYVLDALRRAEAERHQGDMPDLHAVHAAPAPAARDTDDGGGDAARPRAPWLIGGAAAAGVAAIVLVVWQPWRTAAPEIAATAAPGAAVPVTGNPPVAAPAPSPSVLPPAEARPPPVAAAEPPPLAVPPRPVLRTPPPADAAGARADGRSGAPANPAGEGVVPFERLAPDLRAALPALAFGGATDSPVAAARMLIINGQVFREGETVAPGLVLERITLRSAVLRFRGQRFESRY